MREPPGPCGVGRLRCVWLCGAGPLCVPVGGGPPARSPHASLAARSGRSRSPARPRHRPPAPRPGPAAASHRSGLVVCVSPALALPPSTGTAARPCKPPQAPRRPPIGRCSLSVRCRPGPATAHRHRSQAHHHPAALASSPHTPHSCTDTQFRMQFPSGVVLVCVSLQCCVTRVFELHATFA